MIDADEQRARTIARIQRRWEQEDKEARDSAVLALLQHRQGRKYLYWLLAEGKALGFNAFTGNALSTAFNCGQQQVGHFIMEHILAVSPDGFLTMLKEAENERSERAAERAAAERAAAADE